MTANSPSSYSVSLMLHGAFAAAVVLTAFVLKDQSLTKQPKILELVAGDGDNWAALDAPALGTPGGVKFEPTAALPTPMPTPEPVALQPEPFVPPAPVKPAPPEPLVAPPVERPPVTPAPAPVTPLKPEVKKPEKTISQTMQQMIDRREKRILDKHHKEQAAKDAKEKAAARARDLEKLKITKADFDKMNGKKPAAGPAAKTSAASYQRIDTSGLANGVAGGTTDQPGAGGKAISRAEQDQMDTYFAMLTQKLRAAHEHPAGVSDRLSAQVEFLIASNGAIGQVRITKSSGNAEFDKSVLAAFSAVRSIGPRPDGRSDKVETTFKMKDDE